LDNWDEEVGKFWHVAETILGDPVKVSDIVPSEELRYLSVGAGLNHEQTTTCAV
jgi:hypothetical protein